jgi:hypothetical protein
MRSTSARVDAYRWRTHRAVLGGNLPDGSGAEGASFVGAGGQPIGKIGKGKVDGSNRLQQSQGPDQGAHELKP